MQLKLDENLGARGAETLTQAGHDVATVPGQKLCSSPDRNLIRVCQSEKRCLVTLDADFGNPLLFKPPEYSGIAVLRLPRKPTPEDLQAEVKTLAQALLERSIVGKLWIIQRGRIREYQPDNE